MTRRAHARSGARPDRSRAPSSQARPLILTLQLDPATTDWFETLRRTHFPPALNRTPAHLTLFHSLPGDAFDAVLRIAAAAAQRPPFPVNITGLMPLGRGVAYALSSPELAALHRTLKEAYAAWLTRQDREQFRPHVTIQNKVSREQAHHTLSALQSRFTPFPATAEGLQLWHYDGGPWSPAGALAFTAAPPPARSRGFG